METPLNQNYWDTRYAQQQIGWDLGTVSPPLQAYFDQLPDKTIKILIPGGGNSYEAVYLLQQGFTDVTVVDLSAVVIETLGKRCAEYLGSGLNLVHQDFFEHTGKYDLIVEQTFFCALDPALRVQYVQHMQKLLKVNGKLAGLLFDRDFVGGPPFGGHAAEYQALMNTSLSVLKMEPCYNSIGPRQGSEVFFIAERLEEIH
ncbi:methyltransferase domain-containing protein [Arundinibacter roseus]|uniref:Methyltransferase domain-containing protein n=1 Tax=Arundinibacter roseus TaxID=2070510 RepID=A0A4R4KL18_9BACT|nr:methyltransferase domain-containing protein [Arundinibacter roseus]TDB69014.1 methyltransferase domain-containing protein [Arundinibacter roseus]